MPIDYGTNSVTTSGLITAISGNFTQALFVSGIPVSISGHTHNTTDIINFNSSVSGLLPTIANSGDNRILTSTGSSVGINAESNLTFNGSLLNVNGSGYFSSGIFLGGQSTIGNIGGQYISFEDGLIFLRRNDDSISISLEEDLLTANNGNSLSWGDRILYGSNGFPILYWADKIGIYNAIPQYTLDVTGSGNFSSGLFVNGTGVSISGHVHTSSDITDFHSAVSGLFSKTYSVFLATNNQPPASAFATLDTRNSVAVLDFDDTTKESAVFVGVMPQSVALASGLSIRTHWMATTATSGDCRWEVSLERSNTDLDSDSFDTVSTGSSTTNGTAGIPTVTSITLTTIDSVAAGDLYRLRVSRDAANGADTMVGDAELIAVEVRSAS